MSWSFRFLSWVRTLLALSALSALLFTAAGCLTGTAKSEPTPTPVANPSPTPEPLADTGPLLRVRKDTDPITEQAEAAAPSEATLKQLLAMPAVLPPLIKTPEKPGTKPTGTVKPKPSASPVPSPVATLAQNPGLVVCYPRTPDGAPDDLVHFSAGCGLYLAIVAAGRGEFGQTPLLTSVHRVRAEMKLPHLRLDEKDGAHLAALVGATHVAVGTMTEKYSNVTLTYRVYTKDGTLVGAPLTYIGTRDDLTTQLSTLAAALSSRLGGPSAVARPMTPCGIEMTSLGECELAPTMTGSEAGFLASFAPKNPAAALLQLTVGTARLNRKEFTETVAALLNVVPENPLIYSHIAYLNADALAPYRTRIEALAKRYPKNYALAHTIVELARTRNDAATEKAAANRAIENAPRNPDAYLALGEAIAETARRVRKSKTYGNMTTTEQAFVARVYPEWLKTVRRATELDPKYGKAWLRVAEAATFSGDRDEAAQAWENATKNGCKPYDLYGWGLQMFQEKWGGDPAKLRRVADAAVKADYATVGETVDIARTLKDAGLSDLHQQMLGDLLKKVSDRAEKEPKSAQAHYDLALVSDAAGDAQKAMDEYEIVTKLRPKDAEAQYDLGSVLLTKGEYQRAATALQEAVRLAPDDGRACCLLAWTLKHQGQLPEAEQAALKAVNLRPDYAQGWCVLGAIYAAEKKDDECVTAYKKALALWPQFPEAYQNLWTVYERRKDWENGLKVLEQLVAYRRDDAESYVNIARCYQMKKDWKHSEEASRYALMLDENNAYAHANLGVALLHQGKKAEGKQSCEKAIALSSDPQLSRDVQAEMTKLLKASGG